MAVMGINDVAPEAHNAEPGETFSDFLKREFRRKGWTIGGEINEALASWELGIGRTTLVNLLDNPDAEPKLGTILRIARGLNRTPWYILKKWGMAVDMGATDQDRAARYTELALRNPDLLRLLEGFVELRPEDQQAMLEWLEYRQSRRQADPQEEG